MARSKAVVPKKGNKLKKWETDQYRIYRRAGSNTIFVRSKHGKCKCYKFLNGKVVPLPSKLKSRSNLYGRVNFANSVRFGSRVRTQETLKHDFEEISKESGNYILSTGRKDLPSAFSKKPRLVHQGMDVSATNYAKQHYDLGTKERWEWCHLLAHSLGGDNNPANLVAALRGNNSEQLAIESALSEYRQENKFKLEVSAALVSKNVKGESNDVINPVHIGSVIKYEVFCGVYSLVLYLDCLNAPSPSEIHFFYIKEKVCSWANSRLEQISQSIGNKVTSSEKQDIRDFIGQNGY